HRGRQTHQRHTRRTTEISPRPPPTPITHPHRVLHPNRHTTTSSTEQLQQPIRTLHHRQRRRVRRRRCRNRCRALHHPTTPHPPHTPNTANKPPTHPRPPPAPDPTPNINRPLYSQSQAPTGHAPPTDTTTPNLNPKPPLPIRQTPHKPPTGTPPTPRIFKYGS